MNLGLFIIIFLAGCIGIFPGIRFKNKWILFPSILVATTSGVLIILTFLLVGGIK